jgi:hypothetical protein
MAVAREEIDSAACARAAHVSGVGPRLTTGLPAAKLWRRGSDAPKIAPDDSAILLVKDFSRENAWTVTEERPIDGALIDMACAETDALLVVRCEMVIGLVTFDDVKEPRSLQVAESAGFASRREMQVRHVMVPWGRIPVLDWRSLIAARARHVEEWGRNTRASHALLVEQIDGSEYVRGLLSRAHLERSFGRAL